jgi:hypothetical protein
LIGSTSIDRHDEIEIRVERHPLEADLCGRRLSVNRLGVPETLLTWWALGDAPPTV